MNSNNLFFLRSNPSYSFLLPTRHLLLIRQLRPLLNRTTHPSFPALSNITRIPHLRLGGIFLQILHINHIQRLLARSMQMDFRDHALACLISLLAGVVEHFFLALGVETPFAAHCQANGP
jgi:hypothetical protein